MSTNSSSVAPECATSQKPPKFSPKFQEKELVSHESEEEEIEDTLRIGCAISICSILVAVIALLVIGLVITVIVVVYTALLLNSFADEDISDNLSEFEITVNGTTGWDLNALGAYPILLDGYHPTWSNRTISKLPKLADMTWRYDSTCSESSITEMKRRGIAIADLRPRPIPCEVNPSQRCVRIPFHIHLTGSNTEKRYWEDGTNLTYRGIFHHDYTARHVSSILTNNPVAGASSKSHVDHFGTPQKIEFPDPPKFAGKGVPNIGTCTDVNKIVPEWTQKSRGYDFPENMARAVNQMLFTSTAVSNSYVNAGNDRLQMENMLKSITKINAEGPDNAYSRDKWNRRDTQEKHIPSESALAFIQCLHFNGNHPETRTHPQRCVKVDGKEVVVAEEFGAIAKRNWVITNETNYQQFCSDVEDPSECGEPCGYFVLPLGQEIMSVFGLVNYDPQAPEGRATDITLGHTIVDFEEDGAFAVYSEVTTMHMIREKPSPRGPPVYYADFRVGPNTWGGPPPDKFDGRGGHQPGLAVFPYQYAQKKTLMKNMHILYFNLYKKRLGNTMILGGCGMPDKDIWWSDKLDCKDDERLQNSYKVLREASMYKLTDRQFDKVQRVPKFTDDFHAVYAFVKTLQCATSFTRANRRGSHGIDWMEINSWGHQLTEYPTDLELENFVMRRQYWNDLAPETGACPAG